MVLLGDARRVCQFTRGRFEPEQVVASWSPGFKHVASARIGRRQSGRRDSAELKSHALMILADGRVGGL